MQVGKKWTKQHIKKMIRELDERNPIRRFKCPNKKCGRRKCDYLPKTGDASCKVCGAEWKVTDK